MIRIGMITKHMSVAALAIIGLLFAGTSCKKGHDNTGVVFAPQYVRICWVRALSSNSAKYD